MTNSLLRPTENSGESTEYIFYCCIRKLTRIVDYRVKTREGNESQIMDMIFRVLFLLKPPAGFKEGMMFSKIISMSYGILNRQN